MNFEKLINNVTESVKDFDFKAAGRTVVDTAKTTGAVLSQKSKEIHTHYRDLKAANSSKPKVAKVKVEPLPQCLALEGGGSIDCITWMTDNKEYRELCKVCQAKVAGLYVGIASKLTQK